MQHVEPIKSPEQIKAILDYLQSKNERDYMLFMTGLYSTLLIRDILRLQVKHIKDNEIAISHIHKGHLIRVPLNEKLREAIHAYIKGKEHYEYLFPSREGYNQPITRQMAHRIIKDAGFKFGLESLGTHSLRKTFGYHYYRHTQDVDILQRIYGHTTDTATLRYIGVLENDIRQAYLKVEF